MGRIVILGSGGRLGAALVREWRARGENVVGFTRQELDIGNPSAIRDALDPMEFDVLVNCAALTNVDYCETHEDEAMRINAEAVGDIGRICSARKARCIHISTDYVFDGGKQSPYTEEDEARPISIYGASKLAGEREFLNVSGEHLVVRVSWVFGPDRPSFVDQVLSRAKTHEHVEAIGDKWAVPTYTMDCAHLLFPFLHDTPSGGLLHLCNTGGCTWQEYGQYAIQCALDCGVPLKATTVGFQKMADLKAFIAKRPPYTVMATEKIKRLTGREPQSWQEAVKSYVAEHLAPALSSV